MKLPDTAICVAAMDLAREHSPAFLFNHVMRSFAFGHSAGLSQGAKYDVEMLFLGSVLHDLGLVDRFVSEGRFEVDGADAAAEFLSKRGYSDKKIAVIWDAIALHTTLQIPQRKQPEIALVQLGAGVDVGAIPRDILEPSAVEKTRANCRALMQAISARRSTERVSERWLRANCSVRPMRSDDDARSSNAENCDWPPGRRW
jgi:hypothetical protein